MIIWEADMCQNSDKGNALFNIFSEHYAINDVKIILDNGIIVLKKYNVLGWEIGSNYFNLYEDGSKSKKLRVIYFDEIKSIEV